MVFPMKKKGSSREKQQSFSFGARFKLNDRFGGADLKSNPKKARPISTKESMHVVLKSYKAVGPYSLLRREQKIFNLIEKLGKKLNVRVVNKALLGNHVHLLLKVSTRTALQNYLRALAGLIARIILGAERSKPSKIRDFFTGRPFSRIVAAGRRSWNNIRRYFELNRLERAGFAKAESRAWNLREEYF